MLAFLRGLLQVELGLPPRVPGVRGQGLLLHTWSMKRLCRTSVLVAFVTAGCASTPHPRAAQRPAGTESSPLGPSYVLVPVPSDDNSLLGRVLSSEPSLGRALEEMAVPNPCQDKLEEARESAMDSSFEDAHQLSAGAAAKATLASFGFSGDVQQASHFVYKISTSRRIARNSTSEYLACCKEKDCGYGYVSALIYGSGEYASAEESSGSAGVDIAFARAEGTMALKILHRRKVKGWMAAVVTVTGEKKSSFGVLGDKAAAGLTDLELPQQVRALYEGEKISVAIGSGSGEYRFLDSKGLPISENEFVRRYRKSTGSSDLDDVETRRNKVSVIVLGAVTALSVGAMAYALTHKDCERRVTESDGTSTCTKESTAGTGSPWFWAGLGGTGVGGFFLIKALFNYDGNPEDHRLTEYDAKLYAGRHNRAALRKASKDVERVNRESRLPSLRLLPVIGTSFLGLAVSF